MFSVASSQSFSSVKYLVYLTLKLRVAMKFHQWAKNWTAVCGNLIILCQTSPVAQKFYTAYSLF